MILHASRCLCVASALAIVYDRFLVLTVAVIGATFNSATIACCRFNVDHCVLPLCLRRVSVGVATRRTLPFLQAKTFVTGGATRLKHCPVSLGYSRLWDYLL